MNNKFGIITLGVVLAWVSSIAVYAAQIKVDGGLGEPLQAAGTSCSSSSSGGE